MVNLFFIALVIWLGGNLIRVSLIYDLYEPFSNFILKSNYTKEIQIQNIYLYSNSALYTNISYLIVLISSLFLFFNKLKELKLRGWLFMSLILILLLSPFELYNIYCDYQLYYVLQWEGGVDYFDGNIQRYCIDKFTNQFQRSLGVLSYLSGFTSIILFVWKPMDKINQIEEI